jgi:flagellar motor switch protein FliG
VAEEVKEKVMKNLSTRAAEMLVDEIAVAQPQRRRAVEEAQGRIVATVRRLEEAEAITIVRADGEDEELV